MPHMQCWEECGQEEMRLMGATLLLMLNTARDVHLGGGGLKEEEKN